MKILILINGLYPECIGGIEKIGTDLAVLLAKKHDVVVFTSFFDNFPMRETRNNVSIRRFKSSSHYRIKLPIGLRTIHMLMELRKESFKPDVILSMGLGWGVLCYLSKYFFGIPFLNYALGDDWYIARDKKWSGAPFRLGIRKCDRMITQTNIVKQDIMKYFPGVKIEVIPNGIMLPVKRASGNKVIYLGRLHEVKGIRYLIDAVSLIENCPEVIIAGYGPEEETLKTMAAGRNIIFTGRVSEVEDVFMQGKIFVLPSLSEGLPQAMLEAMSYGLPVIATKVGGIPDVIKHGKNGYLVEPKRPEEIKKYLECLLMDEHVYKEMSENCLNEIKKYSWENILIKVEDVMKHVVGMGNDY